MQNLLQRDLGSSLLSIAVILGWLGLFFVFLRILTFTLKNMLEAIAQAYETASSKGDNCILLTSPIIRKDLSNLIRQNIDDLHVLALTELPETRRINIIATIENKLQEENNK